MDCHSRELLGWHLSRSGKSKTAEAALERALIARYGTLGCMAAPFLLRSDYGLVFTSRSFTAPVRSYGLCQEFITLHSPEQNGMIERLIRTPNSNALTASLRDSATRQPCHRRLDQLLQQPAASPSAGDEDTR